jgi:hypothetical protein
LGVTITVKPLLESVMLLQQGNKYLDSRMFSIVNPKGFMPYNFFFLNEGKRKLRGLENEGVL